MSEQGTSAADDRQATIRIGGREVVLRVLDSSDGMEDANCHFQEVMLLTEWIERVKSRFWITTPSRAARLELARCRSLAVVLQAGCSGEQAGAIVQGLTPVFDELLPGAIDEIPEVPGSVTIERLARVCEERRKSLGKLLDAVVVHSADREQEALEQLVDHAKDESVLVAIMDAVIG